MKNTFFFILISLILFVSCSKKDDNNNIQPIINVTPSTPSPMGDTGTTFSVSMTSVSNVNASITSVTNNISSVHITGKVVDNLLLIALSSPAFHESWYTMDGSGNIVGDLNFKFAMERVTNYVNNDITRPFTVVQYDWNVGDSVSAYIDKDSNQDSLITRKCIQKSTTDDYYWNGLNIKTLTVEEKHPEYTVTYKANHKFGIVYCKLQNGLVIYEATLVSSVFNL